MNFARSSTLALAAAALIAPGSALAAGGGIDTATAAPGSASASPLQLNGVLVLNKSDTTSSGANVTVLQVAGLNLLSKNGQGVNQGALAVAGGLLDTLNQALCKNGQEAAGFCIGLLFSNTTSTARTDNASGSTLAVTLGQAHIRLLGSETSTTHESAGCVSTSLGYIANFENVVALPGNALENGTIAGPGAC